MSENYDMHTWFASFVDSPCVNYSNVVHAILAHANSYEAIMAILNDVAYLINNCRFQGFQ